MERVPALSPKHIATRKGGHRLWYALHELGYFMLDELTILEFCTAF